MPQVDAGSRRYLVTIIAIMVGQFVAIMNVTLLTTALPSIIVELDATAVEATWAVSSTTLSITVTALIWGRLGDRLPPLVLMRIGLGIMLVGVVVAVLAVSPLMLIAGRVVQGLGLGGTISLGMIVLARIVPPRERGRYMAWMSAAQLTGTLTGPFIGGLFVESPLGWRGSFAATLLLCLMMLVLLHFSPRIEALGSGPFRFDYLGAVLISLAVPAFLVWVTFGGSVFGFFSPVGLVLLIGSLLLLALAFVVEWRSPHPLLPIRVLREGRVPRLAALAAVSFGTLGVSPSVLFPIYFQTGRGVSPVVSGLLILGTAVGTVLAAFAVGALTRRTGWLRRYLLVGGAILTIGATLLGTITADASFVVIVLVLFVLGLGHGASGQFVTLAAQNAVRVTEIGAVSGFLSFVQTLAAASTLAIFGSLLTARVAQLTAEGLDEPLAYATAIPPLFFGAAAFAVVGTLMIALMPPIRLRTTIDLDDGAAAQD